ncbi:phytanoyl-CoA dioxygenase family protein [Rhodobacteraceae bacterium N5(2021)]|uniref:Phytanoyl-CoA dioxygenase family protein n=1 Tax=Gymnodinialimonas phycosphaerae TaxID=2841589 RepID=A0A975TVN3_9RHOB|nr:phytanoyl-CoA dioxygenase family protein [Gymnodinialimonas phycosphaerae]MBY4891293.1 phytanoyl-CoA dioxygenase family protein [Gymnodinialimonas phycosphaerae]
MTPGGHWFSEADVSAEAFLALVGQRLAPAQVPHAARIEANVPVYDVQAGAADGGVLNQSARWALMAEWMWVLRDGPGVLKIENSYRDPSVIDAATAIFERIITEEAEAEMGGGDHFAKAGHNARIWNALEKLCRADPEVFARYHGCAAIDAVSEAWLGPWYQMTAQVNVVRPGGAAQTAHRDYHLGFMSEGHAGTFPPHAHALSPMLTLQGGVAHGEVPVAAGPTKLLPFSQAFLPGYLAFHRTPFRQIFEDRHVQLPLAKGDLIFFNPALFHGAGANRTQDVQRMVNLFQVSSCMGRAMEMVDRDAMCRMLYPVVQRLSVTGQFAPGGMDAAINAAAEGYAFPTHLDSDPPNGGLAPESMLLLFRRALKEGMVPEAFEVALTELAARRAG